MAKKLIPKFKLGCKRVVISSDYYSAMNDSKFTLEVEPIAYFTETGIQAGKNHYDLDIIIYATGFRVNVYDFVTHVCKLI